MSTNSYNRSIQYNPIPPRVWSRVQNPCSVIAYKNDDPGANSDFARADYERQMLLKGNILQYKKNSSSLTKKQRYTQIAKGMWINRTKTWATQSDTYTNPNMTSLLRVNSSFVDPSNNIFSNPPNPFGCPTTAIPDGGNLVCNVVVDPCTQEIIKRTKSQQLCNPTTDSDVPGQIQDLCWNDGTQTWYPRQRYIMPTSGTKWPQGYKGFVSALTFVGPVLSVGNFSCGDLNISLNWTFLNSTCAPITNFNIYQNGVFILSVPVSQTSVTIQGNPAGTYSFYVTSLSNAIESEKSNIVVVSTEYGYSSENTNITNNGKTITFLENGSITFYCDINIKYTLVGGGASAGIYSQDSNAGSSAGGGGQVLNCSSPLLISSGTDLNIIIGKGGIAPTYEAIGNIGGDTSLSISGSYTVSTNNNIYGGVGGGGATNRSFNGGGGTPNPNNSNGGNYVISTNGIGFGSGGAAGSLTEVDITGAIISVTTPLVGGNASNNSAGNGSNGFQGINGVYYGGGGGGGQQFDSSYSGGNGGLGGGGNGANANGGLSLPTVNRNTGGGGSGGVSGYLPYPPQIYLPAAGGSGIAIIIIQ
jgi:hypothetical protein